MSVQQQFKYHELEITLNWLHFEEVPVGSLLAQDFIELYTGNGPHGKDLMKRILHNQQEKWKESFRQVKLPAVKSGKIIYFKSGDKAHYNLIMQATALKESCLEMSPAGDIRPGDTIRCGTQGIINIRNWLRKNRKPIRRTLKDYGIKIFQRQLLLSQLSLQLMKLSFWLQFIKRNNTSLVVGDFDRARHAAPLFLAARKLGIPSMVIQHGVINGPLGFAPLLADKVAVWGGMQQTQYQELGVKASEVVVTGTPIIEEESVNKLHRENQREDLGVRAGEKLIAFALNPIGRKQIMTQLKDYHAALGIIPMARAFVKVHPAQDEYKIRDWITSAGIQKLEVFPSRKTLKDFLASCDLLVSHSSGLANEALAAGIPVIILDNLKLSPGNGVALHELLGCPMVTTSAQLVDAIEKQLKIPGAELERKAEQIYYARGEKAAANIRSLVESMLNGVKV